MCRSLSLCAASVILTRTIRQVSRGGLLYIRSLCVRPYSIRDIIDNILREGELVVVLAIQKTHY